MNFSKPKLSNTLNAAGFAVLTATAIETFTGGISAALHLHGHAEHGEHTRRHEERREALERKLEAMRNGRQRLRAVGPSPDPEELGDELDISDDHRLVLSQAKLAGLFGHVVANEDGSEIVYYTTRPEETAPDVDDMQPLA